MFVVREWIYRLAGTLTRRRSDADLQQELLAHLQLAAEDERRRGAGIEEGMRAARIRAGGVSPAIESMRDQRGIPLLEDLGRDVRYGIRALMRTPVVTAMAVASLALAIGANTAVLSLIESVFLRSLPVQRPEELVLLVQDQPGSTPGYELWSYAAWEQVRRARSVFAGTAAWGMTRFDTNTGGGSEPVTGMWTSGSFFRLLGITPVVGRMFSDADDVRGGGPDGPVAVLSSEYAERRFGTAAAAVGRTLALDGVPLTVIGVAPPQFGGPEVGRRFDIAVPTGLEPLLTPGASRMDRHDNQWLSVIGRLKSDQTPAAAAATIRGMQRRIWEATVLDSWPAREQQAYLKTSIRLVPAAAGTSALRRSYARPLTVLMVIAALLLAIACANIANLLIARTEARHHELHLRVSLGASRLRLARQLLIESGLLAGLGAAAGLVVAFWGARLLVQEIASPSMVLDLSPDGRVLLFTILLTTLTALFCGVLPATRASCADPSGVLNSRTDGIASRSGTRAASSLVVGQVALSMLLVVAAGLFVRTFIALAGADLGFQRDHVLIAYVSVQRAIGPIEGPRPLFEHLRDAVSTIPGVADAAVSAITPISGSSLSVTVSVTGPPDTPESPRKASINLVSPRWFDTYGIRLLAGRDFNIGDRGGSPPVVIVNQAFARRFFGSTDSIGRAVAFALMGKTAVPAQIVGIAADAAYGSIRDAVPPTMYIPIAQHDDVARFLHALTIRTRGIEPDALASAIRGAVSAVNPNVSLTFRTLADQVDASYSREHAVATLSAFFGVLAVLLAALGLYGITAYAVSRRHVEIGIRMALGADTRDVLRLVLGRVLTLVILGGAIGGATSLWASRFIAPLLYGLRPGDPTTFAYASAVLLTVACVASALPAGRAVRINPAEVFNNM